MRSAESGSKIFPGAEARIDKSAFAQMLPPREIQAGRAALFIGGKWASDIRTLIPIDVQPVQIFKSSAGVFRAAAIRVEILHPHDQPPSSLPGPHPRAMKSPGMPQMEIAGWRRSKPAPIKSGRHCQTSLEAKVPYDTVTSFSPVM